ncbi:hypothetical protein [Erythrobacter crassostreae]|uniref:Uncharacterized protein n=1 Tax=Erythrobacter crassostreae TaxID=2828328 RepID=A0A9X1JLJ5_9SPHN|nr:hypothetical protein [Erythrobacter crassostrea]MBV7260215.1 hypothetical protein [Erythrobacter crassostrea]
MKKFIALGVALSLVSGLAHAQPKRMERDVSKQRGAVAAWTNCIAQERRDEVKSVLLLDYRDDGYKSALNELAQTRVSKQCFRAMPRAYRQIRLTGLPFAGGLAEQLIEDSQESLLSRLSMAAIGRDPTTFSYTDQIAMCTVRGAPHLAAKLFETEFETEEEQAALSALKPVTKVCTQRGAPIEASPLAMRSMLATASYRLLAAQEEIEDA